MRKCPNCKKPVPVGARRCVYCRALLNEGPADEFIEQSTHMGVGGAGKASDDSIKSTTAFGRPLSVSNRDDNSTYSSRNQSFENNALHQTMLGLGPIASMNSGGGNSSANKTSGMNQRTIAGMRGISFDQRSSNEFRAASPQPQQPSREQFRSNPSQVPARQTNPGYDARPSGSTWENERPVSQQPNTRQPSSQFDSRQQMSSGASHSNNMGAPVRQSGNKPKMVAPAKQAPAEDPLAGLAGVAPMPSSLVDEEFVDLTSKLFGDDFAAISSGEEDNDDDGLDFDMPAIPQTLIPKPLIVQPANTTPQPRAPISGPSPSAASSAPHIKSAGSTHTGMVDYIVMGTASIAALLSLIWLVSSNSSLSGCIFLAIAAPLMLIADGAFFALHKKLSQNLFTMIFFGSTIICFIAFLLSSAPPKIAILVIAMVFQFISAIVCFLKKA